MKVGISTGSGAGTNVHPITPRQEHDSQEHWGSSSPIHRVLPWEPGWAKAGPGCRPTGRPGSAQPMSGQGRTGENQRLSMLSSLGKGMMVLGMTLGPGLCGRPQRGWAGTVRAGGALRTLIHISHCCFTFTLLIYCTNLLSKLNFMFLVTDESVLQHARSFCL